MRFSATALLLLISLSGYSQAIRQKPDSIKKPISIFPLPIVYYTPETRLAYGAAVSATFRFKRDFWVLKADTMKLADPSYLPRPSNVQIIAAYTQNKQILLFLPFQVFYDHNKYFVYGEVGYYRYNYNFYGLGQREVPRENYAVDYPRIRLNALRRVLPHLYAGLRYEYENYAITNVDPAGLLATGTVPGGLGGRLSGGGLGVFYDTRDNVFYPTRGIVADFSYLGHGRGIGSNFRYNRYVADVSSYYKLSSRAIAVVNYVVSITGGIAPFSALSVAGSSKRLRGYYEGRYRDDNLALLQAEGRFTIWKRLTGVIFGGVGVLGSTQSTTGTRTESDHLFRLNDPKIAYGAGLRVRINDDGLNIRADYGIGKQSTGLYITIGEAF